ncbi:MAG: superoxide dismutase [Steroidobacteraceae bacterium]
MKHELPKLPYALDALEPVTDAQTMALHHGKHHKAYVEKLNMALEPYPQYQQYSVEDLLTKLDQIDPKVRTSIRNQGGGHANHALFWRVMTPGGKPLGGDVERLIKHGFGDQAKFQEQFEKDGVGFFGSGWTFLMWNSAAQALEIKSLPNQDSPLSNGNVPLLLCDLWEHAYYLRYHNLRADWIKAWWKVVDWDAVNKNLEAAVKKKTN